MIENNSAFVYRQAINKTFVTAFNGIKYFFKTERNGKIQAGVALFILLFGFYMRLSSTEWIFLLLCISAVIGLEIMNSALEHLCNLVHKDYHPAIKINKRYGGRCCFVCIHFKCNYRSHHFLTQNICASVMRSIYWFINVQKN